MSLADEKYLSFTTTKKDGTTVSSPVWVVDLGSGRAGFYTSSTSGKAKRLRHTPTATVQPCDMRGRLTPGTTPATVMASTSTGADLDRVHAAVKAKYGAPYVTMTRLMNTVGAAIKRKQQPYADLAVTFDLP